MWETVQNDLRPLFVYVISCNRHMGLFADQFTPRRPTIAGICKMARTENYQVVLPRVR
jgi:hypothetical protein